MIKSYRGKETKRLAGGKRSKLPPEILQRAALKLLDLDNASQLEDLRFPPSNQNQLESLSGDRSGQHSIRINLKRGVRGRESGGSVNSQRVTNFELSPKWRAFDCA